jgi:hypothetical protein
VRERVRERSEKVEEKVKREHAHMAPTSPVIAFLQQSSEAVASIQPLQRVKARTKACIGRSTKTSTSKRAVFFALWYRHGTQLQNKVAPGYYLVTYHSAECILVRSH